MIIITIYILLVSYIVYEFYRNGFDPSKTFDNLLIRKVFSKKALTEIKKISKKEETQVNPKITEIEKEIGISNTHAYNINAENLFPLPEEEASLSIYEIELRRRIAKELKNVDNVIIDGGVAKVKIPMAATIFLTQDLAPIVTEDGSILIKTETNQISDEFYELAMYLRSLRDPDSKELIYKDDKELIDIIKKQFEDNDGDDKTIEAGIKSGEELVIKKIEGTEIPEDPGMPTIKDADFEEEINGDFELDIPEISGEDMFLEINPMELEKEILGDLGSTDFDFAEVDDSLNLDQEPEKEVSTQPVDEAMDSQLSVAKKLDFIQLNEAVGLSLTDNILTTFKELAHIDGFNHALLNNLVKTKYLVFNTNKEAVYIDEKNFIFAISKLFGINAQKALNKMTRLSSEEKKEFKNMIQESLSEDISDIVNNSHRFKGVGIKQGTNQYNGFGIFLKTASFLTVLSEEDYAIFRTFPYSKKYSISGGVIKGSPFFVSHAKDVELED